MCLAEVLASLDSRDGPAWVLYVVVCAIYIPPSCDARRPRRVSFGVGTALLAVSLVLFTIIVLVQPFCCCTPGSACPSLHVVGRFSQDIFFFCPGVVVLLRLCEIRRSYRPVEILYPTDLMRHACMTHLRKIAAFAGGSMSAT